MGLLLRASGSATAQTASTVSVTSLFLQLMVGLAVVLGLIWVASRVMRGRVGTVSAKRRSNPLAILGRQPLGKGVQIAIVKAGADTYLLGITAHHVTRLASFRPDTADAGDPSGSSTSTDDLPAVGAGPTGTPAAFRLQSTIRQLQDRSLRRG